MRSSAQDGQRFFDNEIEKDWLLPHTLYLVEQVLRSQMESIRWIEEANDHVRIENDLTRRHRGRRSLQPRSLLRIAQFQSPS